MYAFDLRTTKMRFTEKRGSDRKNKTLTKIELIMAGGVKHRIYALSTEEAEKLLYAVRVETIYARINHGKVLLEMLRKKSVISILTRFLV